MDVVKVVEVSERIGRLVLWLAISSVCVLGPLGLAEHFKKQHQAQEKAISVAAKAAAEAAKVAAEAAKTKRIPLASMGSFLHGTIGTKGYVTVSNVSPRDGFLCLRGTLTNPATKQSVDSLPSCIRLEPYASDQTVTLSFPGGNLGQTCGNDECKLSVEDAPEAPASP